MPTDPAEAHAADDLRAAAAEPAGRFSWSATERPVRVLLGLALVLTVGAALVLVQALRLHRVHQSRTVAGPVAVAVDAAGCPIDARCSTGATAPAAMLAAIRRAFPGITVLSTSSTADAASGRQFQVRVVARTRGGGELSLTAQRLPGAPANDPEISDSSIRSHTDLSGNLVEDARTMRVTTTGAAGCSLSLIFTTPGSDESLDPAALALAHDPQAQLTA